MLSLRTDRSDVHVLVSAQPEGANGHLPQAAPEGEQVRDITGGVLHSEPSAEQLVEALARAIRALLHALPVLLRDLDANDVPRFFTRRALYN